jgi:hypothetical protein
MQWYSRGGLVRSAGDPRCQPGLESMPSGAASARDRQPVVTRQEIGLDRDDRRDCGREFVQMHRLVISPPYQRRSRSAHSCVCCTGRCRPFVIPIGNRTGFGPGREGDGQPPGRRQVEAGREPVPLWVTLLNRRYLQIRTSRIRFCRYRSSSPDHRASRVRAVT